MSEEEKRFKVKKIEKYNDKLTKAKVEVVLYTFFTSLQVMMTLAASGIGISLDSPGIKLSSLLSAGLSCINLKKMIEAIAEKTVLKHNIEDLNFELELEKEKDEEEGKKL